MLHYCYRYRYATNLNSTCFVSASARVLSLSLFHLFHEIEFEHIFGGAFIQPHLFHLRNKQLWNCNCLLFTMNLYIQIVKWKRESFWLFSPSFSYFAFGFMKIRSNWHLLELNENLRNYIDQKGNFDCRKCHQSKLMKLAANFLEIAFLQKNVEKL